MRKVLLSFGSIIALTACAPPVPVIGHMQSTGEQFVGQADPMAATISGKIVPGSISCSGKYNPFVVWNEWTPWTTEGTISCSDGRSGTWIATGTNMAGKGAGTLGGKPFSIELGTVGMFN